MSTAAESDTDAPSHPQFITIPDTQPAAAKGKRKPRVKPSAPATDAWFSRLMKVAGRTKVAVNDATEETDVLSLAIHSGISTDEAVGDFIKQPAVLARIASAFSSATTHNPSLAHNADGSIVTRYDNTDATFDPRIGVQPLPTAKGPARWAVRNYLVPTVCSLLDENERARSLLDVEVRDVPMEGGRGVTLTADIVTSGSSMVTFRDQRRDLFSIPILDIEEAETDIMTTHKYILMRELICIRRMLHTNSERAVAVLSGKMREAEGTVRAEKELRVKDVAAIRSAKDKEIADITSAHAMEVATLTWSRECIKARATVCLEEEASRRVQISAYCDEVVRLASRMTGLALRQRAQPAPLVVTTPASAGDLVGDDELSRLKIELEDAKLEITRLKDDSRAKLVPKPKAHRKSKDPDLHLATETDIKNTVRAHMSSAYGSSGSRLGTPTSSVGSNVLQRARRRAGMPAASPESGSQMVSPMELSMREAREVEAARQLKSLSRSREQDLCNAESASEQLAEVVESLSAFLTRVSLTIEDVSNRRTTVFTHLRALAMHSRGIASIIRERPHLLDLARRMNHERKPVVVLTPLRALINVASDHLKGLRLIESITLESVGGVYSAMSLEDAAALATAETLGDVAWRTEEVPLTPVARPAVMAASAAAPRILTRATLRHRATAVAASVEFSDDSD